MFFIVVFSAVALAQVCNSDVTMRVHFVTVKNVNRGDLGSSIFLGSTAVAFKDNEPIALSKDGRFITDPELVEDVPGISVQRIDGGVRFLLYGSHRIVDKEILAAEISFDNAKITRFENDAGHANTYPWGANKLEGQGDGKYILGNTNYDEVFPGIGTSNASWYSTVTSDNDGFYLYLECNPSQKIVCSSDSDCGSNGYVGASSCSGSDVMRSYQSFKCSNPATIQSSCSATNTTTLVEHCSYSCSKGTCIGQQQICGNGAVDAGEECDDGNTVSGDGCSSDCLKEGNYIYVVSYVGDIDGAVSEDWFFFYGKLADFYDTNKIPGSFSFYPATIDIGGPAFSDPLKKMYLSPYIELIQKGYNGDENEMKMDKLSFAEQKAIVQRGLDTFRYNMSILLGKGMDEIVALTTYDQIGARFTEDTKRALEELGFNVYFDVYVGDGLQPVQPTENFDVIQYGVSFTETGAAGPENKFKPSAEIIKEIKGYDRGDVPLTRINGHLVVPLFVHQQDFESSSTLASLDNNKWNIYTTTLLALKNDAEIKLLTPKEVYNIRHNIINPPKPPQQNGSVCQFAKSATATSENSAGSLAVYATGPPDAPLGGVCTGWSGYGYSWTPSSWNVKGTLTLSYENPVYVSNLTVFGDYDMCWSSISLKNSKTGVQKQIVVDDVSCILKKTLAEDFLADTVVLESCGWGWSATDAVELCGSTNQTLPLLNTTCSSNADCGGDGYVSDAVCSGNNVTRIYQTFKCSNPGTTQSSCSASNSTAVIQQCSYQCSNGACQTVVNQSQSTCQYAKSATATSENSAGSLAMYVTGKPDAPRGGDCTQWSGYGYSWTPSNWNVKGTLTLSYENPVYVTNLTITGDYDMCWSSISLKNSKTGVQKQIVVDDKSCILKKTLAEDFLADTVVLESCGWGWSATDAVELCGKTDKPVDPINTTNNTVTNITICTWKDCKKGAVSVSVDDQYTSCMSELEANGYRGTYFLTNTDSYSADTWRLFDEAFKKGHEIGTHMREHWCIELQDSKYYANIEGNINDIINHTSVTKDDIVSHAYPCGFTNENITRILSTNWNFLSARGYNYNQVEDSTPKNFFDLKSYNSHGYPGGNLEPGSYFDAVDKAEREGKWLNMVFHNECSDDGVIDYLPSKSVWVDTLGNVVRYIKLRDSAVIYNYSEVGNEVKFSVKVDNGMDKPYYHQSLTVQAPVGSYQVISVFVNGKAVAYSLFSGLGGNYVMFDLPFPVGGDIVITKS
jgi:cysteine-rich repeat protein